MVMTPCAFFGHTESAGFKPMKYFSEREEGEQPRQNEEIVEGPWGGVQALVRARIEDGSFGATRAPSSLSRKAPARFTVRRSAPSNVKQGASAAGVATRPTHN